MTAAFYSTANGLVNTQLLGGTQPAGAIAQDGSIWFPSIAGPIRIAPENIARSGRIPIHIEQVVSDGRTLRSSGIVDLGTSGSRIEIHYGAIELRPQTELRFHYKLEDFDTQWIDAGQRRIAYYTNLSARRYRFLVSVTNVSAPDIASTASLTLIRRPEFYRTVWFYSLCAVVFLSLVLLVHRARTLRLHATFQAVLGERTRLAREMHDTLIQGCTSISSLLEALNITAACTTETGRALLDTARLQASSTIEEARQAVWGLRHDDLSSSDPARLLREVADQIQRQFSLPVNCTVYGRATPLHPEISHHLLMATGEALYNAARHGKSSCVTLGVHCRRGRIIVEVADDGAGFQWQEDADATEHGKQYGLMGIRERMRSIGGEMCVTTAPGRATHIVMTAPARRAKMQNGRNGADA